MLFLHRRYRFYRRYHHEPLLHVSKHRQAVRYRRRNPYLNCLCRHYLLTKPVYRVRVKKFSNVPDNRRMIINKLRRFPAMRLLLPKNLLSQAVN